MTSLTRIALLLLLTLAGSPHAAEDPRIGMVRQVIAEQTGMPVEQIDDTRPLSQQVTPADALDCYDILMALEEHFNVTISDALIENVVGPYEPQPGPGPSANNSIADRLTVGKLVQLVDQADRR